MGLPALLERGRAALEEAVNLALEDLVGRAQAAESAVRTGTLRASIHTDGATSSGNEVSGKVMTGGESSAYAAYIHEGHRADGTHVVRAYPGGLKYIERPLIEMAPTYRTFIARAAASAY
ncbi:MAG TPA: hypothetical protein VFA96_02700 [Nocardioides sp.]|nr:hypothetical protein [Nocardioides sp.]